VPTIAATVMTTSCATPCPPEGKQTTDVDDAHAKVVQLLTPRRLLGVASTAPKLTPDTVTLHPTVVATLNDSTKLTTGAARIIQQKRSCLGKHSRDNQARASTVVAERRRAAAHNASDSQS
jgi:hypothetical protein